MAEIIACPTCQRKLQVPSELLGQTVQCPECKGTFAATAAPAEGAVQSTAPPPAPAVPEDAPARPSRRRFEDDEDDLPDLGRRGALAPHRGGLILAFGVMSLVVCGLFGPVAWVMGNADLAAMQAGTMDREGEGLTQAGRVLGMIASLLMILSVVGVCALFGIAGIANIR